MPPSNFPDSGAIDAALVARLNDDAALKALMPDGVWFDVTPAGVTRFVLVSLATAVDTQMFGRRAFEQRVYDVKAIALVKTGADGPPPNLRQAAAQIDYLLQSQPLTAENYQPMCCLRVRSIRYVELDAIDPSIQWRHQGGQYDVQMSVGLL